MAADIKDVNDKILELNDFFEQMLLEQKKLAHGAIEMKDWGKSQRILSKTNNNIPILNSCLTMLNKIKNNINNLQQSTFTKNENDKILRYSLKNNFAHKKVIKLYFFGREYSVPNLSEAFYIICFELHNYDKTTFEKLLSQRFNEGKTTKYITTEKINNRYKNLENTNIYINMHTSSDFKIFFIGKMLDFYGLQRSEISFDVIANKEFNIK